MADTKRIRSLNVGLCRAITGHHWRIMPGIEVKGFKVVLRLQCTQCPTKRTDTVSRKKGIVERRGYGYGESYKLLLKPGDTRPNKAELRTEAVDLLLKARHKG